MKKRKPFKITYFGRDAFAISLYATESMFNNPPIVMDRIATYQAHLRELAPIQQMLDQIIAGRDMPNLDGREAKESVAWEKFLHSGYLRRFFTHELYEACHLHLGGFIAHYNLDGFYAEYFDGLDVDPGIVPDRNVIGPNRARYPERARHLINMGVQDLLAPNWDYIRIVPDVVRFPVEFVKTLSGWWWVYGNKPLNLTFAHILKANLETGIQIANDEIEWLLRGGTAFEEEAQPSMVTANCPATRATASANQLSFFGA